MWKEIQGYPGYNVSDSGQVQGKTGIILKEHEHNGYRYVNLHNRGQKSCLVHRLVATAFLPGVPLSTVNHKNGLKSDNRASNLEWSSHKDNIRHAIATGLMSPTRSKTVTQEVIDQVHFTMAELKCRHSDLMEIFGLSKGGVYRIMQQAPSWGKV